MLKDTQPTTDSPWSSSPDDAPDLAALLHAEFGVPFRVVAGASTEEQPRVTPLPDQRFQLLVPLRPFRRPDQAAVAEVAALAPEPSPREQALWQGWLQAVADRLVRQEQQRERSRAAESLRADATTAWETLFHLDQLTRGLRTDKDPVRICRRILETAYALVPMQTLLWVPHHPEDPVLFHGDTCLTSADCRHLVHLLAQIPTWHPPGPLLWNPVPSSGNGHGLAPWARRLPQVVNLVAFLVTDPRPLGWVVAVNKADGTPFRRRDAAVLTPFVALLGLQLRNTHRYQDLKEVLVGLTRALVTALDAKDAYTSGHSERTARVAVELGRELGLGDDELGDLYLAGLLHDVGKIGVHDAVLRKADELSPEEWTHVRRHVAIGHAILADLGQIRNLLPGVLYHHERWDGAGYPNGLKGEQIPLMARILAVADAYDAMSQPRPYRDALPCETVEQVLVEDAGRQWDGRVVEAFLRCKQKVHGIRQRGVGDSLRVAVEGALPSGGAASPCAGSSGQVPDDPLK